MASVFNNYCYKCGTTNETGARYCRNCGHLIPLYYKCIYCHRNNNLLPINFCQHCGKKASDNKGDTRFLLIPFIEDGKLGYMDYYTNFVYLPPKYYAARLFSDGLAAVRLNQDSRWVFINESGDIITDDEFNDCSEFNNGLAIVEKNHLQGVININGKTVIPCEYKSIVRNSDGYFHAHKDNKDFLFGKNGKLIFNDEKCCIWDVSQTGSFDSKSGVIKIYDKESHLFGLINSKGETVISPIYEKMESFSEGLCAVYRNVDGTSKWGFIDLSGQECIPCQFQEVDSFHEGVATFSVHYKEIKEHVSPNGHKVGYPGGYFDGFMNSLGEIIVEADRYHLCDSAEGLIQCNNEDGLTGFLNSKGEEVIPCQYKRASNFKKGLAVVENHDGKHGLIDKSGNIIIPFEYDFWYSYYDRFNYFRTDDNLFILMKDGKFGVIDIDNHIIIPNEYDEIIISGDKYFIVKKEEEYGLINHNGEFVIPMGKYYRIEGVYNSLDLELYRVYKDSNTSGIIDVNGLFRIPCEFYYINNGHTGSTELVGNMFALDSRPDFILEIRCYDENRKPILGKADLFCNYQLEGKF